MTAEGKLDLQIGCVVQRLRLQILILATQVRFLARLLFLLILFM